MTGVHFKIGGSIPVGAILAVLIFIWTVNDGFWAKLTWFSGGLFGLALIILFFCNIDWKRRSTS